MGLFDLARGGGCGAVAERSLTPAMMRTAAANGTVFVTFADHHVAEFAVNWARRLQAIGLRSLIGLSEAVERDFERDMVKADAAVFCALDAGLMASNGQAGRWAEAVPVVRLASQLSLSVVISDADIAWIRNPLPYFFAARAAHPRLDLLMMTDRAFNGYSDQPLGIQPPQPPLRARSTRGAGGKAAQPNGAGSDRGEAATPTRQSIDLELEPGYESAISYNIGILWLGAHALQSLEQMLLRWVDAVGGGGDGHGSKTSGSSGVGGKKKPVRLASWDQEPINKLVLQRGLRPDPIDRRLVRVDDGRLAMGVLPMLQFVSAPDGRGACTRARGRSMRAPCAIVSPLRLSGGQTRPPCALFVPHALAWSRARHLPLLTGTPVPFVPHAHISPTPRDCRVCEQTTSFTYFMQRRRRESLGATPYCLHAIFAHGKDADRKRAIFREEGLWMDPPHYYDPPARAVTRGADRIREGFLVAETSWPLPLRAMGGFDLILTQLRQVHQALRLAALLNRTLVLPRLRCGERPMAYPCYAWYHRAMAYFGLNVDKVSPCAPPCAPPCARRASARP